MPLSKVRRWTRVPSTKASRILNNKRRPLKFERVSLRADQKIREYLESSTQPVQLAAL